MNTKELHEYIFREYVWGGKGQAQIIRQIEKDKNLQITFGGIPSAPAVSYHVKQIHDEMEGLMDGDAIDRFVAEYMRYQTSIDKEIQDVDEVLNLIDKEEKPALWLSLKKFRKELLDSRVEVLTNNELPATVKKLKKERQARVIPLKEVQDAQSIEGSKEIHN